MFFICPKCSARLTVTEGGAAVCENRHSFDRSRQGYYNLLLSSGGAHGDNAEMVAARQKFLSRGYYEPLAECLCSAVCEGICDGAVLLDSGMGEGYYTRKMADGIAKGGFSGVRIAAFDISKDAARRCSVRMKGTDVPYEIAVASAYKMPIADVSVDVVANVFSPLAVQECRRVLKMDGRFIYVIPAEEHLLELKAAIYDDPYLNAPGDTALEGFTLMDTRRVRYKMELTCGEDISALFMMTPYAYRTGARGRERVMALDSLSVSADFEVLIYERT